MSFISLFATQQVVIHDGAVGLLYSGIQFTELPTDVQTIRFVLGLVFVPRTEGVGNG